MKQVDRAELAIWAEQTTLTVDNLVAAYRGYLADCEGEGVEPDDEGRWAEGFIQDYRIWAARSTPGRSE